MKFGLTTVWVLGVALILTGCATTIGRDYDQAKVAQFVPGQTTLDQVIVTLGSPMERETESNGEARLRYQLIVSKSSGGSYIPGVSMFNHGVSTHDKDTFIYFNTHGRFVRAENNETNTGA